MKSDNSSGAAKGHAKHEAVGDGLNHGQSQKALHESDNSSGAAKGHAKHETAGEDSNRGQAHGDLQAFENGSAAGKQHAHHPQVSDLDTAKPQRDIPTASVDLPTTDIRHRRLILQERASLLLAAQIRPNHRLAPNLAIPFILRMAPTIRLQTCMTYSN